jgi:hypothetical protein
MNKLIIAALNAYFESGPTVESETVLGGKQKQMEDLYHKIATEGYTSEGVSDDEANLMIYCMLDYAFYGKHEKEVLEVFEKICPMAADTIKNDEYLTKYHKLTDEELPAWYKGRCEYCTHKVYNNSEGWCYMFKEFIEGCQQYEFEEV